MNQGSSCNLIPMACTLWFSIFFLTSVKIPGVSHQTFGFRTQSNSIGLFHSIKFNGVRPSNEIEHNRTFDFRTQSNEIVRLSSVIEVENTLENRTKSNFRFSNSRWQGRKLVQRWNSQGDMNCFFYYFHILSYVLSYILSYISCENVTALIVYQRKRLFCPQNGCKS